MSTPVEFSLCEFYNDPAVFDHGLVCAVACSASAKRLEMIANCLARALNLSNKTIH